MKIEDTLVGVVLFAALIGVIVTSIADSVANLSGATAILVGLVPLLISLAYVKTILKQSKHK